MALRIGRYTFPRVVYDPPSDVLYATLDDREARWRERTPEDDVLLFDREGEFFGLTVMEPRERLERDGAVHVTLPSGELESVQGIQPAIGSTI